MRLAPALLLALLAGCLAPAQAPAPAAPSPAEAAMRAYLRTDYPRADAVEWGAVRILSVHNETVGDVPLVAVTAAINREGKEATAWFRAADWALVRTNGAAPDYRDVAGGKMGWDLVRALRTANATDELRVIVELAAPERPGTAAAWEEENRTAAEVRGLPGIANVTGAEWPSYPELYAAATPEGVRALEARADVLTLDLEGQGTFDPGWA